MSKHALTLVDEQLCNNDNYVLFIVYMIRFFQTPGPTALKGYLS